MTGPATPKVSDFILQDPAALVPEWPSASDDADTFARLRGHFAIHLQGDDGAHLLGRDILGVNKLFFALGPGDQVRSSNYFFTLVQQGFAPNRIWSVPSGYLVRVAPAARTLSLKKYSTLSFADAASALDTDLPLHAARIRERLERTFQALGRALQNRRVYVTLSGGLDSTTVAALAREHIPGLTAVTFAVSDPGTAAEQAGSDRFYARRVAESLDIPLEFVEVSGDALLGLLDEVLIYGQDFRDFNVHCGLVNAAIARAIAGGSVAGSGRPVVLTGDTMNELMADYTPVEYAARDHYALPHLSPGRLRRFLVSGLDSGDREVGIFARWGIDTIQPYALMPEAYTALPGGFLDSPSAKQRLARWVMGDRIPAFIYDRPKVRAQVGSSEKVGGTLAALVDRGVDAAALERRFCELVGFDRAELQRWIRMGVYRFTTAYPEVG